MIYCVVPEELAGELYDKLADYYEDDPNVTVIIDRRKRGSGEELVVEERRARPATPPGDALPASAAE